MFGKLEDFLDRIIRKCELLKYNIAILDNDLNSIVHGEELSYRLLKHNERNWFADPFVLGANSEQIVLLVEEYNYKKWKGEIAKLTINRNTFKLINKETILSLDTHLSYPAIMRLDENILIYPENGMSGSLNAYVYDIKTGKMQFINQILNIAVADATITDLFGERFMFCTHQNVCSANVLTIYKEKNNNWVQFQIVRFKENIARMAGDFFKIGNTVYRPAQDCNDCYGHGTVIQKVSLIEGRFVFEEIRRYFSPDKRLNHGIHTLNSYNGITVVDMEGWERPMLAKIAKVLRKITRRCTK